MKSIPRILSLLMLLSVALSLINSSFFGPSTLTAYFLSSIALLVNAFLFTAFTLASKRRNIVLPVSVWIFAILGLFVLGRGLFNGGVADIHLYWAGLTIFLIAGSIWSNLYSDTQVTRLRNDFYMGIVFIALIESSVVVLQAIKVIPSANRYFVASGTWVNPNVTAMFLSICLFGIIQRIKQAFGWQKLLTWLIFILTLASILLLRSRTAYIATLIIVGGAYGHWLLLFFKRRNSAQSHVFYASMVGTLLLLIFVSLFLVKGGSSNSRLHIWQNSIRLVAAQPITGYGFGLFEAKYNLFAARFAHPANTFVISAYNDYLEIWVEGGIVALILWMSFLLSLFVLCWKRANRAREFLPLILAFAVMQSVNFVVQAIPVMLIFLCFIMLLPTPANTESRQGVLPRWMLLLPITVLVSSPLIAIHQYNQGRAFHRFSLLRRHALQNSTLRPYKDLYPELQGFSFFHESIGDLYFKHNKFKPALLQYTAALKTSSRPALISKAANCFTALGEYKRGEHFYQLAHRIAPAQFAHLYSLLKLYELKGDSVKAILTANIIVEKAVKVPGPEVDRIKMYAAELIRSNDLMKN